MSKTAIAHPVARISLGEKLHLFRSPVANTTQCLIWGHGGLLYGDGTYGLPVGVTIRYFVDHGQPHTTGPALISGGPSVQQARALAQFRDTGPTVIRNYRLRKGVGNSGGMPAFAYHDVQDCMKTSGDLFAMGGRSWCPHVVSVRRRFQFIGKTIQLGEIIDTVLQQDPAIDEFIYAPCRNDLSAHPWQSAAKRTRRELFG